MVTVANTNIQAPTSKASQKWSMSTEINKKASIVNGSNSSNSFQAKI